MASEEIREILKLLNDTNEITKGDKLTPQGLVVLADMLAKEFTAEQVALGIRCHLIDCPFFPVFSDISKQLRDPQGEAWEAWRSILEHIKSEGYMNPPTKLPKEAQAALDCIGGYTHICEIQSDQINVAAAQFVRAYGSLSKRENFRKQLEGTDAGKFIDSFATKVFQFPK